MVEEKTGMRSKLGRTFDHKSVMIIELVVVTVVAISNFAKLLNTPILIIFVIFMVWIRQSKWREFGMYRPSSWPLVIIFGVVLGVGFQVFNIYIFEPVLGSIFEEPIDLEQFTFLKGNLVDTIVMLVVVWLLAAFGEEIVYRGYLLKRLTDLLDGSKWAWIFAITFTSIVFGYFGHSYQGIVGAVEASVMATTTCILFLMSRKNLWLPIIFHGSYDTISLVLVYLGYYPIN